MDKQRYTNYRYTGRKPVLVLDCDGVLANFCDSLLPLIGSKRTTADVSQWDIFGLIRGWYGQEKVKESHDILADPAFWRDMKTIAYAREAVDMARVLGFRISIATADWGGCLGWLAARRTWCKKEFELSSKEVNAISDKSLAFGHAFIDDKEEHVIEWGNEHLGQPAYLYDQPYNAAAELPKMRWSPDPDARAQFFDRVLARIRDGE